MSYDPNAQPGYPPQQPPQAQPAYPTPPGQPGYGAQPAYPSQAPGYPAPQAGAPAAQPGYGYPPAQPRPNPLAGTPISDWIRDGAAFVLLLVSLALPWSYSFTISISSLVTVGAGRIEVLLITILSVLSLAVTYLARFGALGPGLTPNRAAALRAALNAPFVVLVLVYIVLDAAKVGDVEYYVGSGIGLGAGAAFGLTGALLAAAPRAFEVGAADGRWPIVRTTKIVTTVLFGVIGLTVLLGAILTIVDLTTTYAKYAEYVGGLGSAISQVGVMITGGILLVLLQAVAVVLPLVFVLRGSIVAARITGALGIATLGALLIGAFTGYDIGGYPNSLYSGGYPLLWFAVYAAVMTSPALIAGLRAVAPLTVWFTTARRALVTVVYASGVLAVLLVLLLITQLDQNGIGLLIGILICQLAAGVLALVARIQLITAPQRTRLTVLSLAGAVAVAELISLILGAIATDTLSNATFWLSPIVYLILIGLPAVIVYALTVPASVREYFAAYGPARTPQAGYPAPAGGASYGVPAGPPAAGYAPTGAPAGYAPAAPPQEYPQAAPDAYAPAVPQAYPPAAPEEFASAAPAGYAPALPEGYPPAAPETYAPAAPATYIPAAPQEFTPAVARPAEPVVPAEPVAPPTTEAPVTPPVPAAPPVAAAPADPRAQRAADPATPSDELYGYTSDPSLWPALAANPGLYPELVTWLASTGDPATLQALQARGAL